MYLLATSNGIIQFLLTVLIIVIAIWVLKLLADWLGVPQPIKTILYLIAFVVAVVILLDKFTNFSL
jgi:hypothetical protein